MGMRPQRRAQARGDTGALGPLRGRTYAHGRRHCSALRVPPAKEKKSLTAKAAEDTKETILEPNTEENAKTSPSMEWPHPRRRWTLVKLVMYHPRVAITSLGAVLADLGLNLLCSLGALGGTAFLRLALRPPRPPR